jgi:hypothetical protein
LAIAELLGAAARTVPRVNKNVFAIRRGDWLAPGKGMN